jgi:hypothetical protein
MKILIADSGSTKCDWMLIDESGEFPHGISYHGLQSLFPQFGFGGSQNERIARSNENCIGCRPRIFLWRWQQL